MALNGVNWPWMNRQWTCEPAFAQEAQGIPAGVLLYASVEAPLGLHHASPMPSEANIVETFCDGEFADRTHFNS